MAFEFSKFIKGNADSLYSIKKDLPALSGYALYNGQALKVTGGALCYADSADTVYAISNVSAASSVVTASYYPEYFPVNDNQVWKSTLGSAITALTVAGSKMNIATSTTGTGVAGDTPATGLLVYKVATAESPTSAIYVIFAPSI
ncbi:MAG: hypothetical protein PHQ35_09315 [Phycisphaerae bacterium]|nr:hypothetical protein [Phycisphaerae bacterium]MDD5239915.1 hypothetical protein [Candidatus Nanoarchaeia archaeon]